MDTMQNPMQPQQAPGKKLNKKALIIGIVAIWVIAGLIAGVVLLRNKKDTSSYTSSSSTNEETENWTAYTSTNSKFKALFPTTPQEQKETIDEGTPQAFDYYSYMSQADDGSYYIVNRSTYSASVTFAKPEVNLQNGLDRVVESQGGNELVSSNMTTFDGNKALEFHIKNDKFGLEMKGRFIAVAPTKTAYQQLVVYRAGQLSEANFDKFTDSFELLP